MLSATQQATLNIIKSYILEHDYSPTISEIMRVQELKSRSLVQRNLQILVEQKYIQLIPHRRRNIVLVKEDEWGLPLIGRIAAGQPIEAIPQPDILNLPELLIGVDRYLLEVKGDSMIGDNICDGDLVLCESTDSARSGDIVVVLVDHEHATLKRIHHNKAEQTISLIPSNPAILPEEYAAERITIQGRYLGLLRLGELTSRAA